MFCYYCHKFYQVLIHQPTLVNMLALSSFKIRKEESRIINDFYFNDLIENEGLGHY